MATGVREWKFERQYLPMDTEALKEIPGKKYCIGRHRNVDIICESQYVSRRHLILSFSNEDGWSLTDLGSLNGTFINGSQMTRSSTIQLQENDQITLGFSSYSDDDEKLKEAFFSFVFVKNIEDLPISNENLRELETPSESVASSSTSANTVKTVKMEPKEAENEDKEEDDEEEEEEGSPLIRIKSDIDIFSEEEDFDDEVVREVEENMLKYEDPDDDENDNDNKGYGYKTEKVYIKTEPLEDDDDIMIIEENKNSNKLKTNCKPKRQPPPPPSLSDFLIREKIKEKNREIKKSKPIEKEIKNINKSSKDKEMPKNGIKISLPADKSSLIKAFKHSTRRMELNLPKLFHNVKNNFIINPSLAPLISYNSLNRMKLIVKRDFKIELKELHEIVEIVKSPQIKPNQVKKLVRDPSYKRILVQKSSSETDTDSEEEEPVKPINKKMKFTDLENFKNVNNENQPVKSIPSTSTSASSLENVQRTKARPKSVQRLIEARERERDRVLFKKPLIPEQKIVKNTIQRVPPNQREINKEFVANKMTKLTTELSKPSTSSSVESGPKKKLIMLPYAPVPSEVSRRIKRNNQYSAPDPDTVRNPKYEKPNLATTSAFKGPPPPKKRIIESKPKCSDSEEEEEEETVQKVSNVNVNVPIEIENQEASKEPSSIVDSITRKMDNNRLSQVMDKKEHSEPVQDIAERRTYVDKMIKQGAVGVGERTEEYNLPSTSNNGKIRRNLTKEAIHSSSEARLLKAREKISRYECEIQVYKDIFKWRPSWIKEQEELQHILKMPPPVLHGRPCGLNLLHYSDYCSYFDVFYPLLIHELWASIISDRSSPQFKLSGNSGNQGILEIDVGVVKIDPYDDCPIVTPNRRDKKGRRVNPPHPHVEDYKWHRVEVMAFVNKRLEIEPRRDLVILSIPILKENGGACKDVFGILNSRDYIYEDIRDNTQLHPMAYNTSGKKPIKVNLTILTHMSIETLKIIDYKSLAHLKKICYITPRFRDFKALAYLTKSKLFNKIINPDTNNIVCDMDKSPPQHFFVSCNFSLNAPQKSIIHHIFNRIITSKDPEMMLLHGPPGTGKSKTIVGLVMQLLTSNYSKDKDLKILICTPSNTAIDEIIVRLHHLFQDLKERPIMVRLGSESDNKIVKQYSWDALNEREVEKSAQCYSLRRTIQIEQSNLNKLSADIKEKSGKKECDVEVASLKRNYDDALKTIKKYKEQLDSFKAATMSKTTQESKTRILYRANVICSTLNSCSNIYRHFEGDKITNNKIDLCIVDEATQSTEPETLSPLLLGVDKLLLVGDPFQLNATVLSNDALNYKFDQSLFSRHFKYHESKIDKVKSPVMTLTIQYRMHPNILYWPNRYFYKASLVTSRSITEDPSLKLKIHPYLFLNLPSHEEGIKGKISNNEEIVIIITILRVLNYLRASDKNHENLQIGIISPYQEQKKAVLKAIKDYKGNLHPKFLESLEVSTVDSFQGREKDIILLSCVRTEELGFLKNQNRLNVALTRAKKSLIIIGNALCLTSDSMWKSLIDDATTRLLYRKIPDDYKAKNPNALRGCIEKLILLNNNSENQDVGRMPRKT